MAQDPHRAPRQQFSSRVRIAVKSRDDVIERFADNIADGGMFIRDETPPAAGSMVLLEFVLPDGSLLCRVSAKVAHARPATIKGDKTAGMGLQFVQYDKTAQELVHSLARSRPGPVPGAIGGAVVERVRAQPSDARTEGTGPVVGIDLGTTNSCVAIVNDGSPRVISTPKGYETVPSVLFITAKPNSKVLVGHQAVEKMILEPHRAIYGSKRFLGRPFASRELRTYGHFFHYELAAGVNGLTCARIDGRLVPLEVAAGYILTALRTMASQALGTDVKRAIITVPAYFGESQRQSVREAGRLAGLHVERVISEPTAAAVAYGYGRGLRSTVLVYDLGGGTFDASILRIEDDKMEVLATGGDPFLGGSDFDDRLTEYVLMSAERQHKLNVRNDPVAVQRVRFVAELCKRQLSQADSAAIDIPYFAQGPSGPVNIHVEVTRELFERLTRDLADRTLRIVEGVLKDAGLQSSQLDDVIMVGGQSRTPYIRQLLSERFSKTPSRHVHPDHAVAIGAAIIADASFGENRDSKKVDLTDVLPVSLRRRLPDGKTQMLLARGTALPASHELTLETSPEQKFELHIVRGEAEAADENEPVGRLLLPSSLALAITKSKAKATLNISAEGIMTVSAVHPVTGQRDELVFDLKPDTQGHEPELLSDADVVPL